MTGHHRFPAFQAHCALPDVTLGRLAQLFGTSVDLARRICDHSEGGAILVSDVVRQLAAGKDFLFSDRGAADLKGFEDPVRLYEVRWREET